MYRCPILGLRIQIRTETEFLTLYALIKSTVPTYCPILNLEQKSSLLILLTCLFSVQVSAKSRRHGRGLQTPISFGGKFGRPETEFKVHRTFL